MTSTGPIARLSIAATLAMILAACAFPLDNPKLPFAANRDRPFERNNAFPPQGDYEAAYRENHRALRSGVGAPDKALYNMGVISAHSANPKKNYSRALRSFRTLVENHPHSQLAEPAKIWIQALEERQKVSEEKRQLIEDKENLARTKEQLVREQQKLKFTLEKSRQVDLEIERRRRQTLER